MTESALEGSTFVKSLRSIHPFEAYLTAEGSAAARRAIPVFGEGETTGIVEIQDMMNEGNGSWYTLDGRKLQGKPTTKGLYIRNGRKIVVR